MLLCDEVEFVSRNEKKNQPSLLEEFNSLRYDKTLSTQENDIMCYINPNTQIYTAVRHN